ncbi:NRDE family protein [Pseudomonas sp. NPDC078416]|uniref:NRDE family protein n=1 Tax=Pseudomonas sp. NPDC078416 TaxID=3390637 RepID=UPI003CFCE843
MCLIVFAWRPSHPQPLILAANRDEFYARPTLPLAQWEDAPQVYAGRDLEAGGTWLGINADGRFAALTNIREPGKPPGRRSRGELVAGFLSSDVSMDEYLSDTATRATEYGGFNLLVGDRHQLHFLNANDPTPLRLEAGVYGVSNAGLDTPWPKLVKAKAALSEQLHTPDPEALFGFLADHGPAPEAELPNTGVGLATEKLLSSVFIASPNYGTRASTVLLVNGDGSRRLIERSFGPYGGRLGEVDLQI